MSVATTLGTTYGTRSPARKKRTARAATPSSSRASSSEMPSITVICAVPKSRVRSMLDQKAPSVRIAAKLAKPVKTTRVGPKPSPALFFSCRLWLKA